MNITLASLTEYLKRGLEQEIGKEFDEQIKVLNSRKNEICAGILLNAMSVAEFRRVEDRIIFEIREIKK